MLRKMLERVKRYFVQTVGGQNYVVESFPKNEDVLTVREVVSFPVFRAAVRRIAQSVSSVPLVLYKGQREAPPNDPNWVWTESFSPALPTAHALSRIVHDLYIYGNSIWAVRRLGKKVDRLEHIPPSMVFYDPFNKTFTVFPLTGDGEVLGLDEVVWFKLENPEDPDGWGRSVAEDLASHIKTILEADIAVVEFLRNGAVPIGMLKLDKKVSPEILERKKEELKAQFGRGQRFNWFVVTGDAQIETPDTSLKLGDLPDIRKTLREEILAALNVPPAVLGFYEYANYANAREQTKIFWRETVIPLLNHIAETLNLAFFSRHIGKGYWVSFDLSQIPHTKENLSDIADSLVRLTQAGIITINEAREILGKDSPVDWGDTWWGNISVVPIAHLPEEKSIWVVKGRRVEDEWFKFLRFQARVERDVKEAIQLYTDGLRRKLKRQLKWLEFNEDEEFRELWELVEPILSKAYEQTPSQLGLSVDWKVYEPKITGRLLAQKKRIRWVTEETWEQLQQAIARALEAGGSTMDIAEEVERVLGALETYRAERIARTEGSAAVNGGALEAMVSSGVEKKMWLAALDERTRPAHRDAHGQVVPVGEPFLVGGYRMQYPCDPNVNAPEMVINCRCTVVPVD